MVVISCLWMVLVTPKCRMGKVMIFIRAKVQMLRLKMDLKILRNNMKSPTPTQLLQLLSMCMVLL